MIFSAFERMVALRYLRARRQEGFISVISWFSIIGIGLGVATLIVVMSVMNGFREELFQRVLGLNGHLNLYAEQKGPLTDYEPILDRIKALPGVIDAAPTVEGQALVTHEGVASGVYLRGVTPDAFRRRQTVADHIISGDLKNFSGEKIAIGVRLAERLNLMVGQNLTLISPVSKSTVFGSAPRLRAYTICAIFDVGMQEYDNGFVFMPLPAAQLFLDMGEGITSLEVFAAHPEHLEALKRAITEAAAAPGTPSMRLLDWQENNSSFVTALEVEKNVMFLILMMIIIVAAFNVISGLFMLVKDKGRDIAILRTMGASKGMIMRIFFLNGATVGIAGTMGGVLLGVLVAEHIEVVRQVVQFLTHTDPFSAEVYFLTRMPSDVEFGQVIKVVLMSIGISFVATLYPSLRAARLDPVEALRYE